MKHSNPTRHSTTGGQHNFAQIPSANIQRSKFQRNFGHKTHMMPGLLYPVFVDEALPGDTLSLKASLFARLATPLHPIMDNIWMDSFYFAVPYRLIWDHWAEFNGAQKKPGDSTDFEIPQMTSPAGGWLTGSVSDYMGIPIKVDMTHSALFHRAYNLIFSEWFRDENLVDPPPLNTGDGPDAEIDYKILRRGKRHDYFTSCLPWPQKGPAVELPLGLSAPVVGTGDLTPIWKGADGNSGPLVQLSNSSNIAIDQPDTQSGNRDLEWYNTKLETDLSQATSATINTIRQAFQIQKLYERDARGGTRLTEVIKSHFGVSSPDSRLQRPEYLGGNSTALNMQVIPQTGATGSGGTGAPTGHLGGFGTVASTNGGFHKSFTEHCIVIGLVSSRADLNYQQGLNKMFSRKSRWDHYWPSLQGLGEQAVLNKEIYMDGTAADDEVFGYQERWAEYRYKPSLITGFMRSTSDLTLDSWHLAQDFGTLPVLDETFIGENPPIARVISTPSEATFIFDSYFQYSCVRPMPAYSVPGLIDHF